LPGIGSPPRHSPSPLVRTLHARPVGVHPSAHHAPAGRWLVALRGHAGLARAPIGPAAGRSIPGRPAAATRGGAAKLALEPRPRILRRAARSHAVPAAGRCAAPLPLRPTADVCHSAGRHSWKPPIPSARRPARSVHHCTAAAAPALVARLGHSRRCPPAPRPLWRHSPPPGSPTPAGLVRLARFPSLPAPPLPSVSFPSLFSPFLPFRSPPLLPRCLRRRTRRVVRLSCRFMPPRFVGHVLVVAPLAC
jgi:hypothetical protein